MVNRVPTDTTPLIYHITTPTDWEKAQAAGSYEAASLKTDRFIHCSYQAQVLPTVERFFNGRTDLIILTIDPDLLDPSVTVIDEDLYGHGTFPHVYGVIALEAVVAVTSVTTFV